MGMKTMGDWDQIIRTLLAIIMIMGFTLTSTLGGIICHYFKRITLTTLLRKSTYWKQGWSIATIQVAFAVTQVYYLFFCASNQPKIQQLETIIYYLICLWVGNSRVSLAACFQLRISREMVVKLTVALLPRWFLTTERPESPQDTVGRAGVPFMTSLWKSFPLYQLH